MNLFYRIIGLVILITVADFGWALNVKGACKPVGESIQGFKARFFPYAINDETAIENTDYITTGYLKETPIGQTTGILDANYVVRPCETYDGVDNTCPVTSDWEDGGYGSFTCDGFNCNNEYNAAVSDIDIYGFSTTATNITVELTGYFYTGKTGNYTFALTKVDDAAGLTIGAGSAFDCCDQSNKNQTGYSQLDIDGIKPLNESPGSVTSTVYLQADSYYPIKLLYVNIGSYGALSTTVTLPDDTVISAWGNMVYSFPFDHESSTADCVAPLLSMSKNTPSFSSSSTTSLYSSKTSSLPEVSSLQSTLSSKHSSMDVNYTSESSSSQNHTLSRDNINMQNMFNPISTHNFTTYTSSATNITYMLTPNRTDSIQPTLSIVSNYSFFNTTLHYNLSIWNYTTVSSNHNYPVKLSYRNQTSQFPQVYNTTSLIMINQSSKIKETVPVSSRYTDPIRKYNSSNTSSTIQLLYTTRSNSSFQTTPRNSIFSSFPIITWNISVDNMMSMSLNDTQIISSNIDSSHKLSTTRDPMTPGNNSRVTLVMQNISTIQISPMQQSYKNPTNNSYFMGLSSYSIKSVNNTQGYIKPNTSSNHGTIYYTLSTNRSSNHSVGASAANDPSYTSILISGILKSDKINTSTELNHQTYFWNSSSRSSCSNLPAENLFNTTKIPIPRSSFSNITLPTYSESNFSMSSIFSQNLSTAYSYTEQSSIIANNRSSSHRNTSYDTIRKILQTSGVSNTTSMTNLHTSLDAKVFNVTSHPTMLPASTLYDNISHTSSHSLAYPGTHLENYTIPRVSSDIYTAANGNLTTLYATTNNGTSRDPHISKSIPKVYFTSYTSVLLSHQNGSSAGTSTNMLYNTTVITSGLASYIGSTISPNSEWKWTRMNNSKTMGIPSNINPTTTENTLNTINISTTSTSDPTWPTLTNISSTSTSNPTWYNDTNISTTSTNDPTWPNLTNMSTKSTSDPTSYNNTNTSSTSTSIFTVKEISSPTNLFTLLTTSVIYTSSHLLPTAINMTITMNISSLGNISTTYVKDPKLSTIINLSTLVVNMAAPTNISTTDLTHLTSSPTKIDIYRTMNMSNTQFINSYVSHTVNMANIAIQSDGSSNGSLMSTNSDKRMNDASETMSSPNLTTSVQLTTDYASTTTEIQSSIMEQSLNNFYLTSLHSIMGESRALTSTLVTTKEQSNSVFYGNISTTDETACSRIKTIKLYTAETVINMMTTTYDSPDSATTLEAFFTKSSRSIKAVMFRSSTEYPFTRSLDSQSNMIPVKSDPLGDMITASNVPIDKTSALDPITSQDPTTDSYTSFETLSNMVTTIDIQNSMNTLTVSPTYIPTMLNPSMNSVTKLTPEINSKSIIYNHSGNTLRPVISLPNSTDSVNTKITGQSLVYHRVTDSLSSSGSQTHLDIYFLPIQKSTDKLRIPVTSTSMVVNSIDPTPVKNTEDINPASGQQDPIKLKSSFLIETPFQTYTSGDKTTNTSTKSSVLVPKKTTTYYSDSSLQTIMSTSMEPHHLSKTNSVSTYSGAGSHLSSSHSYTLMFFMIIIVSQI